MQLFTRCVLAKLFQCNRFQWGSKTFPQKCLRICAVMLWNFNGIFWTVGAHSELQYPTNFGWAVGGGNSFQGLSNFNPLPALDLFFVTGDSTEFPCVWTSSEHLSRPRVGSSPSYDPSTDPSTSETAPTSTSTPLILSGIFLVRVGFWQSCNKTLSFVRACVFP